MGSAVVEVAVTHSVTAEVDIELVNNGQITYNRINKTLFHEMFAQTLWVVQSVNR